MKIILTQNAATKVAIPTVRSLPYGVVFRSSKQPDTGFSASLFVKLKPTGFLLNSTVIGDILNRGDCLVHHLQSNTLHAMKGDMYARVHEASVVVTDEAGD